DADFWAAWKATYPNIQTDYQNIDYNVLQRGAKLVEQYVVVDVLVVGLDIGIGRLPGRPEVGVDLLVDIRRCVVGTGVPVGQPALVIERHDLGAFGGSVDFLGAGDAAHIIRRPFAEVDALRVAGARGRYQHRRSHQRAQRKRDQLARLQPNGCIATTIHVGHRTSSSIET